MGSRENPSRSGVVICEAPCWDAEGGGQRWLLEHPRQEGVIVCGGGGLGVHREHTVGRRELPKAPQLGWEYWLWEKTSREGKTGIHVHRTYAGSRMSAAGAGAAGMSQTGESHC